MSLNIKYLLHVKMAKIYVSIVSFYGFLVFASSYGAQESYLNDINCIVEKNKPILEIAEYNKQKGEELKNIFNLQIGSTNFASIRVFYRKKGTEKFDWIDLPKSVFFVSTELKIGDPTVVSQWKEESNNENLIRSYVQRGNITDFTKLQNNKYSLNILDGNLQKKNKTFFPIKNLYRWHEYNPLYPDLIHSEQQFLNYCLLSEHPPTITAINQEVIDCILIDIISINAACERCFIALNTLIDGKNNLKKDFVAKIFHNTSPDIPIHILYHTVSNTSMHRGAQRNALKKQSKAKIDLADGSSIL